MRSSRSTARRARKRSRRRRAWNAGAHCRFCPARPICPAHTKPLLDLAQFAAPTPLPYGGAFAAPPAKEAYLQAARRRLGPGRRDQGPPHGAARPGEAGAGKRRRRARLRALGRPRRAPLARRGRRDHARSSVSASPAMTCSSKTMRSPKQVEIRAKARGLKVPTELIVSHRSGVSLVRGENARAPVPGRGEIARSFSAALEAFQEGSRA